MTSVLAVTTFVLYLAVAVLLVRKYGWTGDVGFLWMGLPLVVLPLLALPLAFWLQAGVDRLASGEQDNVFPFTLVAEGRLTLGVFLTLINLLEHVVWGVLALVAVITLRPRRAKDVPSKRRHVL